MGILGIKKKGTGDKMTFVESISYGKDKTEEYLHRLVAENPQLITVEDSEGRRISMATIGSHLRFPDGEIDLLLMDIEGNLTLVELKRDKTPRDVIAQILDYASILYQNGVESIDGNIKAQSNFTNGLQDVIEKFKEENPDYSEELEIDAIRKKMENSVNGRDLQLLIVSYEVGEPIRRVTEYLREVYGVKIYCVEFDYFADRENEYFVPEIIGAEDVRKIKRREGEKELTPTQIEYQNFYGELLANLRERLPGITQQKAPPQNLLKVPVGHSGVHLEWAFHGVGRRDSFEVGLHFERQSQDENKQLFDFFKKQEDVFKEELAEDIQYQFPWGKRWARLYVVKNEGEMTEELKEWAVATMVKFYNVLKPKLDEYFHST
jgi:hypothetical protein